MTGNDSSGRPFTDDDAIAELAALDALPQRWRMLFKKQSIHFDARQAARYRDEAKAKGWTDDMAFRQLKAWMQSYVVEDFGTTRSNLEAPQP